MAEPQLTPLRVDWQAAAQQAKPGATPAKAFAALNAAANARFPGIARSAVPVLLPFDVEAYRKARSKARAAHPDRPPNADDFVLGGFHASKFFLAGPAGYDAAFSLRVADVPV